MSRRFLAFAVLLLLAGCKDAPPPAVDDVPDAGGDGPSWPLPAPDGPQWTVETVGPGGQQLRLAVAPDGAVAVAWFATSNHYDGICEEIPDGGVTSRQVWPLEYATRGADGWEVELVMDQLRIDKPVGLDLAFGPDGAPVIAAQTGEPIATIYYCAVNDVALLHRDAPGTWSIETAIVTSGEAVTGAQESDYGEVVGHWPGLAFTPGGEPAVAYKDVHAGSVQLDDFNRADLELAIREGGSWSALPVDVGRGAGDYTDLVFDAQDRPVVLYANPTTDPLDSALGLWLARPDTSEEAEPDTWETVRLREMRIFERPSLAVRPEDGALFVAWYDADKGLPFLAWLDDPAEFANPSAWESEPIGDPGYDEGVHPSLAFDAGGNVAVAYYRCARIQAGIGACNPADDAVVLARFEAGAWHREVVTEGGDGLCGNYPNLAWGPDGPVVAFQCVEAGEDGELELVAQVATRDP